MKLVLVIEDNRFIRENTAELLELAGYKVEVARNGQEGFRQTIQHHPDLILCDALMPETDGMGFLKLIKEENSTHQIPLIFFSAGSTPAAVRKGLEQGGNAYLPKPFTSEELLSTVETCLNKTGHTVH